jgi:hypothetical protein
MVVTSELFFFAVGWVGEFEEFDAPVGFRNAHV